VVEDGADIEQRDAPELLQYALGGRADLFQGDRNAAGFLGMASAGRCSGGFREPALAVRSTLRRHTGAIPSAHPPTPV